MADTTLFALAPLSNAPDLLFQIWANDQTYRIYASGRVEGFGDGPVKVANHFFQVCDRLQQSEQDRQDSPATSQAEHTKPLPQTEQSLELVAPHPA
jgi:hypothetical protein